MTLAMAQEKADVDDVSKCVKHVEARAVSNGVEAFTILEIGARQSLWYLQNRNWSNVCSGDANGSGLCSVKLLNDGGCRSGTQGRRLGDVGGSMAKGCVGCCDGGSDVEKGVTLIKIRLLRKCQSSGSDIMLEILEDLYYTSSWENRKERNRLKKK